jgi:hypothetical protein
MKIFMLSPSCVAALVLLISALTTRVHGQFTCPLAARDEDGCLAATDDDGSSCVWCSLSSFGFCVNEAAAEAAESTVPGIACDRASPSDDTPPEPPADDNPPEPSAPTPTAPTAPKPTKPHPKPKPPKTDDNIKPNDDSKVPNNFWNCLNHKSSEECKADADGCTWCRSQAGYSICMSGPTADSAKHSKFFKCDKTQDEFEEEEEVVNVALSVTDPYDPSCVSSYMTDPTQEGCTSTTDADGDACEWCSIAGITNVCLNKDQANQGASLGITCQESSNTNNEDEVVVTTPRTKNSIEGEDNLFDTSCVMTLLQDPTESGCVAASDQEGASCQWCSALQGQVHLCLTEDQAQLGQQSLGLECGASDEDSTLSAASSSSTSSSSTLKDPYDPSCMVAFLQDPTEDGCDAASDSDGNPCQFCTIAGFNVCLTIEQAQMSQGAGATCTTTANEDASSAVLTRDYQDASCARAYAVGEKTSEACLQAVDEDGQPCQYCTRDNANHLCLTASQGDLIGTMGFWCDHLPGAAPFSVEDHQDASFKDEDEVAVPDDFFQCLQSYEPDDCQTSGCTWCDSQVGIGFCTSDAVADSMKACTFFDCQYKNAAPLEAETTKTTTTALQAKNFDSTCMNAGFSHPQHGDEACRGTLDEAGEACVWCHTADNAVGLCFSQDQAARASSLLECDGYEGATAAVAASE